VRCARVCCCGDGERLGCVDVMLKRRVRASVSVHGRACDVREAELLTALRGMHVNIAGRSADGPCGSGGDGGVHPGGRGWGEETGIEVQTDMAGLELSPH